MYKKDNLIGQEIVGVRKMTERERDWEGWGDDPHPTIALVLSNGTILYPSMDEEGNGGGALFGNLIGDDTGRFNFMISIKENTDEHSSRA
jgi:hypothetical protein